MSLDEAKGLTLPIIENLRRSPRKKYTGPKPWPAAEKIRHEAEVADREQAGDDLVKSLNLGRQAKNRRVLGGKKEVPS